MTILRIGTSKKYSDNWERAFCKKKKKTTAKQHSKSAKKKGSPKKRTAG